MMLKKLGANLHDQHANGLGLALSLRLLELRQSLRLLASVKRVMQRQTWTAQEHARTSVPHNLLRLLSSFRLITVHEAFAAG